MPTLQAQALNRIASFTTELTKVHRHPLIVIVAATAVAAIAIVLVFQVIVVTVKVAFLRVRHHSSAMKEHARNPRSAKPRPLNTRVNTREPESCDRDGDKAVQNTRQPQETAKADEAAKR